MRICAFGDSFINGKAIRRLGWLERATGIRGVTVCNFGIRGDRSADIRARWRAEAERRFAPGEDNRLVFSFGVNDCCPGRDGERPRASHHAAIGNGETILRGASALASTVMNALCRSRRRR